MKTFEDFIVESEDIVVDGITVKANTFASGLLILSYEHIDRYDGSGRFKKGTPKDYEIESYKEYGLDISELKRPDFPLWFNFTDKTYKRIRDVKEVTDDISYFKYVGIPYGFVRLFYWNDGFTFLVKESDVEKMKDINISTENEILRVAGY